MHFNKGFIVRHFRMIMLAVLLLSLVPINPLLAGDTEVQDSIGQLIREADKDSNLVNRYLDLSRSYFPGNMDAGIRSAHAGYQLARGLDYPRGVMRTAAALGVLYKSIAEFDSAMMFMEVSIGLADSLHDLKQLIKNYNNYGSLLRRKGYPSYAMEYHKKSMALSQQIGDTLSWANAAIFSAMISHDRLEYDTAIHYYYTALRIYESMGHKRNIGVAYLNIGDIYYDQEDPDRAIRYYRKGLPLFLEANDLRNTGLSYNKMGTIYSFNAMYDSALYFYRKAWVCYDSIGNASGLAHLNINIGNVYSNKGRYREAEPYYEKAIEAFESMGLLRGYQNAQMSLAGMYMDQGKWQKALEILEGVIDIARQVDPQALLDVYSSIVDIYRSLGNSVKALEYQDLFVAVKASVFHLEKVQAIADAEMKYEKEKSQARIYSMEKEAIEKDFALEIRTRQRNSYLFAGTGVIVVLVFLFSYYSQRTRKNKIIAEQRIRQLEEEKKLLAARSIVVGQEEERKRIAGELHDGLGVLLSSAKMHFTTVRDKSPESKSLIDKAAQLLEQASGDVRRISHNMMPGLLTKYGFYEAVEDLFEQVDEMEEVHAMVKIEGDQARLNESTEIMLYRIIQEMVNNTLKHAGAKNAELKINILPETIALIYMDDGKGFKIEDKLKSKSMGLTSIQSRTKFLNGKIDIHSEIGKGTSYDILIPQA